jgi:hypothetical protein
MVGNVLWEQNPVAKAAGYIVETILLVVTLPFLALVAALFLLPRLLDYLELHALYGGDVDAQAKANWH